MTGNSTKFISPSLFFPVVPLNTERYKNSYWFSDINYLFDVDIG